MQPAPPRPCLRGARNLPQDLQAARGNPRQYPAHLGRVRGGRGRLGLLPLLAQPLLLLQCRLGREEMLHLLLAQRVVAHHALHAVQLGALGQVVRRHDAVAGGAVGGGRSGGGGLGRLRRLDLERRRGLLHRRWLLQGGVGHFPLREQGGARSGVQGFRPLGPGLGRRRK